MYKQTSLDLIKSRHARLAATPDSERERRATYRQCRTMALINAQWEVPLCNCIIASLTFISWQLPIQSVANRKSARPQSIFWLQKVLCGATNACTVQTKMVPTKAASATNSVIPSPLPKPRSKPLDEAKSLAFKMGGARPSIVGFAVADTLFFEDFESGGRQRRMAPGPTSF